MPVIEVATRKGLFTLAHSAGRWAIRDAAFLGDNVTLSMTDPRDGARYAALDHGHFGVKLHRKRQGGAWEEVAAPSYPEKPAGLTDTDGWGKPIPWATQRIWGLEPGGADQPGLIWCATIPGGLFRSLDHGASWQLVRSFWDHPGRQRWFGGGADLPGLHAICVDPRDSRVVRIGVSCGGVWVTRDGGETWENRGQGLRAEFMPPEQQGDPGIQDVHYMAQCRAAPERMWIQHHNGIFRSDDSGENWTEIHDVNPSTFGFGVVRIPMIPAGPGSYPASRTKSATPPAARWWSRAPETAARVLKHSPTACPRSTPTTWCCATRWRSTRAASAWPSAPPPAGSGPATIRAITGRWSATPCRQSTRCGLRKGDGDAGARDVRFARHLPRTRMAALASHGPAT